jgi:hypothetical protein
MENQGVPVFLNPGQMPQKHFRAWFTNQFASRERSIRPVICPLTVFPLQQSLANAPVCGPPQATARALASSVLCSPGCGLGWPCGRRSPEAGGLDGRCGAGLGWGSVAWSGGACSDDHGQPRIAVPVGSRASQLSGLELLPDLPPRDFVPGGLKIAPQLAVGEGALGFWPALREVFPATRQARRRVHQPADVLSKLPLLRVATRWALWSRLIHPTRWALVVNFQRPMTTVLRNPGATKRNCWPVGPTNDVAGGPFPGPLGRAGGTTGPLGLSVDRPVGPIRWWAMCGGDSGGD